MLAEQARIRFALERIDTRLDRLKERLTEEAKPQLIPATPEPVVAAKPPVLPPPLPPLKAEPAQRQEPLEKSSAPQPQKDLASEVTKQPAKTEPSTSPSSASQLPGTAASAPAPEKPRESLEIRLGKFWLPMAGIVIFITGLVFLGNYAWQMMIHRLGPGGKLALLYLTAVALGGIGSWLERKRQELRNYGRILMAGAAATGYYATYAAHYVAGLRVIEDPVLAGTLLLLLGGAFTWWAHRHKSQVFAVLTILLAYYTAAINPIGSFTLFSNLLLTGAAVFFLIRNGWAAVSWTALIATYGSYTYWRWQEAIVSSGLHMSGSSGLGISFVACYWVLFTAAAFLASREALPPWRRITYVTLNNGFFFVIAWEELYTHHSNSSFWIYCFVFGALQLALAALARARKPDEAALDSAYLVQGLALVTIGIITKFTGPQLALILAVESAVLLTGVKARHGRIFQVGAFLCGALAFLASFDTGPNDSLLVERLVRGAVAAVLIFDGWWLKQRRGTLAAARFEIGAFLFTLPGLILIADRLRVECSDAWAPTAFAVAALICTASIYLIRLPEVALPGQAFLAGAIGIWISLQHGMDAAEPWWHPLPVAVVALALGHWWQKQRIIPVVKENRAVLQLIYAVSLIGLGLYWMWPYFQGGDLLIATTVAAVATLVYGLATGAWAVAIAGQLFAAISYGLFLVSLGDSRPSWAVALVPIAGAGITSLVVSTLFAKRYPEPAVPNFFGAAAMIYRLIGSVLLAIWVHEYVPRDLRLFCYAAFSVAMFLTGGFTKNRERTWIGIAYAVVAFTSFWIQFGETPGLMDLIAILLIPGAWRIGRHYAREAFAEVEPARMICTGAAVASVWLWVTQWTCAHYSTNMLTVSWALLAPVIFAAGLSLRERVYRIGGFATLALAVGRVFLVDVWKLETIYRIVSFLVLGVVLLALGFVYNRYAETIRKWL